MWFVSNAYVKHLWQLQKHVRGSMRLESKSCKGLLFLSSLSSPSPGPAGPSSPSSTLPGGTFVTIWTYKIYYYRFIRFEERKGLTWFLNNSNGQRQLLDWSQAFETQAIHQTYTSSYSCYPSAFPLGRLSINSVPAGQRGWCSSRPWRTYKAKNKGKGHQENCKTLSLQQQMQLPIFDTDNNAGWMK